MKVLVLLLIAYTTALSASGQRRSNEPLTPDPCIAELEHLMGVLPPMDPFVSGDTVVQFGEQIGLGTQGPYYKVTGKLRGKPLSASAAVAIYFVERLPGGTLEFNEKVEMAKTLA